MSEHDIQSGDEQEHRSFSAALSELADTMPDDPYRVEGVHARARRLRTRRRVTRAAGAVVVGAATIAALIAVRPGPSNVTTAPASQPSATLPVSCTADPDNVPRVDAPDAAAAETAARAAKLAAATGATADPEPKPGTAPPDLQGVKGLGTVVSAADGSVTITLDEPFANEPSEITATLRADAELMDGASKIQTLPELSPGDHVAFAAFITADGSYQIFFLGVHAPTSDAQPPPSTDPADDPSAVKVAAQIVSIEPGSLTLAVQDGALAGQTLTAALSADARVTAGDQECVDSVLAPGDAIGALLVPAGDGSYAITVLALPSTGGAKP